MKNFREKADLIWRIADLLCGDYKQSDYGKVILPMTVLRRLDCILEPTKTHLPTKKQRNPCMKWQVATWRGEHLSVTYTKK